MFWDYYGAFADECVRRTARISLISSRTKWMVGDEGYVGSDTILTGWSVGDLGHACLTCSVMVLLVVGGETILARIRILFIVLLDRKWIVVCFLDQ